MSELRVDNIVDMGGSGAPQLRKGANVTGISTITQAVVGNATINAGGINATGIVTSTSNKFVGDFASGNITAGVMTATSSVVASNITINSGGVNASGIVSATSYAGSGANLTGIGLTIAPLAYNPDVSDHYVKKDTGIGLTFNQRVFAGTGNVTLSLVSVGSTVVENFGVGSSVTINNDADPPNITITPTSNLSADTVYAINYPPGAFTQSGAGGSFVGTAYTFYIKPTQNQLWLWGSNSYGGLGQNDRTQHSSPVQVLGGGSNWSHISISGSYGTCAALKSDNTLWTWGHASYGELLGQNQGNIHKSSPTQVPGTTWNDVSIGARSALATKTDGTLWSWGNNYDGTLGLNQNVDSQLRFSSPTQIGSSTDWSTGFQKMDSGQSTIAAIKTDGTLWVCGNNTQGQLGQNNRTNRSSPVQVPGTSWSNINVGEYTLTATKTDGTLWVWGLNGHGQLGLNDRTTRSSPTQFGSGTNWASIGNHAKGGREMFATKTNGELWAWGNNWIGQLAQNNSSPAYYSSPVQIPGTTWVIDKYFAVGGAQLGLKTDGTMWAWGYNSAGELGINVPTNSNRSSPIQIPGSWVTSATGGGPGRMSGAVKDA